MAEIKMSYIFIEKQKHELKTLQDILLEIIDSTVEIRDDRVLRLDDVDISYRIIQKRNSKRCFLEMTSKERVTRSIPALQKVDRALFTSNQQRYYHSIRDYDGISESFCKRLYPKYAEFERKLRSLVLFILTKAYGSNWRAETVSDEMLSVLQEKAHGNVSLNETLENMDLATLETYLFEQRHVDYPSIISEQLSSKCLEELEKEEICAVIEKMRPTSLWERHFEKFGSQDSWMKKIVDIHSTRNKVAHQKTILVEEFTTINRKLNSVNRDLSNAIEGIREENFTEYSIVDILGSFATIAGNFVKNIVESQAIKDVVIGFNAKVQEMLKPMTAIYKSGVADALSSVGKAYANMNLGIAQSEMIKSMNAMAESFSASKAAADSFAATKSIADSFAATKAIADSFASTKALAQSFGTSQLLAESVKTAETIQKSMAFPEWVSYDDDEQTEDAAGETIEENDDN
ncbi:hypothetical protein [Mediterraneibacter agrestimuris]|uniref:hypothetical protein n=1 Tax=Mediterraneibacter agrestimuris TaxID=2941333 RepID=UPI00203A41A3|nr:hypothetical protein [Mediterraneibacter agrestimuris]